MIHFVHLATLPVVCCPVGRVLSKLHRVPHDHEESDVLDSQPVKDRHDVRKRAFQLEPSQVARQRDAQTRDSLTGVGAVLALAPDIGRKKEELNLLFSVWVRLMVGIWVRNKTSSSS